MPRSAKEKNKRLFLALLLPEEFNEWLAHKQEKLKKFFKKKRLSARWVQPKNFHITVCFLGEIPEKHLPQIIALSQGIAQETKPFSLRFWDIVSAPPHRPPTMIWATFQSASYFSFLVSQAQTTFKDFLPLQNHRQTIPHLTLARFSLPFPTQISLREKPSFTLNFSSLSLIESHLYPDGPQYEVIENFDFKKSSV